MTLTLPNWATLAFLVAVLAMSGVAEYIKIAPAGTFYTILLLVVGIVVPSPVSHMSAPQTMSIKEPKEVDTRNG